MCFFFVRLKTWNNKLRASVGKSCLSCAMLSASFRPYQIAKIFLISKILSFFPDNNSFQKLNL